MFHIGENGGCSLFVDTTDGVIGVSGYPGLTARFDRFREEAGNYKPLRYQIVTRHHSDHLGGQLGTVASNVKTIKETVLPACNPNRPVCH